MKSFSNRQLITDFLGYGSEKAFNLLVRAVVGVFVARYLGPNGLGLLSFAQSVFALLAPLTLLGMESVLVREFSTRSQWQPLVASAVALQIPVALVVSVAGVLIVSASRGFEQEPVLVALALGALPIANVRITAQAYLEARGRVRRIIAVGVVAGLASSAMKVAAIIVGAPVWVFALTGSVEATVGALGLLGGLPGERSIAAFSRRIRPKLTSDLLRESWPLLLSSLAVVAYMQADIAMLGLMVGDTETGIYTAAARLSEVWYFIPMAALPVVRPHLARLFAQGDRDNYGRLLQRFMTLAFVVSVTVAGIVLLFGHAIIVLIYGAQFVEASPVLRIHILAAPFVFLGVAANQWFIDRRLTRTVLVRSSIGAGTNIMLNLVLIPALGALGAAVATLVSYGLSGVLVNGWFRSSREVFWMQLRVVRLAWRASEYDERKVGDR